MPRLSNKPIVLASGSASRRAMLADAGVEFVIDPADLDETALRLSWRDEDLDGAQIALRLADAKGRAVAPRHPGTLVLAADSVVTSRGETFEKPGTRARAEAQLARLAGTAHALHSAAVVLRDGDVIARIADTAILHMRPLSPAFITRYLDLCGEQVLGTVGCYALEGLGAQLFERIEGDYFTILGLPLLPVLGLLRREGALPS